MFHVVVSQRVSTVLGQFLHNRELLLAVLNRLYEQLGEHAERYRSRRDPGDPDLFDYVLCLADQDKNWHTLRFSVDDRQATGYLFVNAVSYRIGKARF